MRRVVLAAVLTIAVAALAPVVAQAAPTVTGPDSVGEAAGTATYTVTMPPPGNETVTVGVAAADGATAGADFGAPSTTSINFGPSVAAQTANVTVPIVDDDADEPDTEALVVTATAQFTGSGSKKTTITDNDTTIDVSPATASVTEGGAVTITLTPRQGVEHPVSVHYATAPATAGAADFQPVDATVDWPTGSIDAKTVTLATTQDALDEDDEAFGLFLAPTGASISTTSMAVTIADDDPPPLIAAVGQRIEEGSSGAHRESILVGLSAPSAKTIAVNYATRDGTATVPSDYGGASGRLTFAPGETAKVISVSINGDKTAESDESFVIELLDPENATLVGQGASVIVIADDDGGGSPLPGTTAAPRPPGAPLDVKAPRISLGRLHDRGARLTVSLGCPRGEVSCAGTVTLFSVPTHTRPERRLARARFKVKGGARRVLVLRLSKRARAFVRRTTKVRAYAVAEDAAGNVGTTSVSATLKKRR